MALKIGLIIGWTIVFGRIIWLCAVLWCTSTNIDALLCGYAIMIEQEEDEEKKEKYKDIFTHLYKIRKLMRGKK